MLLESFRATGLGGEVMAIHRKIHEFLFVCKKCLTAREWEFCNTGKLSGYECQIFYHMQAERMRVGFFLHMA